MCDERKKQDSKQVFIGKGYKGYYCSEVNLSLRSTGQEEYH